MARGLLRVIFGGLIGTQGTDAVGAERDLVQGLGGYRSDHRRGQLRGGGHINIRLRE